MVAILISVFERFYFSFLYFDISPMKSNVLQLPFKSWSKLVLACYSPLTSNSKHGKQIKLKKWLYLFILTK